MLGSGLGARCLRAGWRTKEAAARGGDGGSVLRVRRSFERCATGRAAA